MIVTKDFIKSGNSPDIGYILISSEDYKNKSKNLTQEKLRTLCFQKGYHLYTRISDPYMTSYPTSIVLPKKFLDLKDDVSLCAP